MLSFTEFRFELSKQLFWDSVCLFYDYNISNLLPTVCPYRKKNYIQHCMKCKDGFFDQKTTHNDLQYLTTHAVAEECKDAEIELNLASISH